jgi:hypothetical protein
MLLGENRYGLCAARARVDANVVFLLVTSYLMKSVTVEFVPALPALQRLVEDTAPARRSRGREGEARDMRV